MQLNKLGDRTCLCLNHFQIPVDEKEESREEPETEKNVDGTLESRRHVVAHQLVEPTADLVDPERR